MEKEELNEIRKLVSAATAVKKSVKDVKTSILQDLSEESDNDCKKEYFRMIKRLMKLRSRLAMETKLPTDESGKTVVTRIDEILGLKVPSPEPIVLSDGKKYQFKDGSQADISSYTNVMNMNIELSLINIINKLQIVYSEGLAEIMKLEKEKDLWARDDGIEEIDFTKDDNDGRGESEPKSRAQ